MKKLFILPLAVLAFTANSASAQLQFGIKGGVNYSNITISNNGETDDNRGIATWHVGGYIDAPLADVLSLQAGLMVTAKGAKYTWSNSGISSSLEAKTNPVYLELPVNLVGKIPLGDNIKLFAGAGPYVAMGIAGKNSVSGQLAGASYSRDENIEFSNDDPSNNDNGYSGNLKRYDFGINILAGLEIGHLTLNANYGHGLVNIRPGSDNNDNDKFKNRVLSFSVGILF